MKQVLERPEIEDKWEVDAEFVVPSLEAFTADGGDVDRSTVEMTSAYFDTADHDLLSHGVLLRRREGDDEAGWQLKVPAPSGRTEIEYPLSQAPPPELLDLIAGVSLGKDLANVVTIRTTRDRYRITAGADGTLRAEVADDQVRAAIDDRLLAWREIEVEHGPAAQSVPDALAELLGAAGARPARYDSKLAHALRGSPDSAPNAPAHPATRALNDYLTAQINEIFDGDLGLRRGQDPIHDTRVAIRRMRSTLRVFKKLFAGHDDNAVGAMDDDLKWFAALLGEVRDCDVQHRRFHTALADLPAELVLGPVAARITNELQAIKLPAREEVTKAMNSPRYLAMLTTLQQWRRSGLPLAVEPTGKIVKRRAKRAQRKADRRLTEAIESGDGAMLHRARKAAKRARYAAELVRPLDPKNAKGTAKHYKRFQRVLGDHQDSVVAIETLRRLATIAGTTPGENGFTFGVLYERERAAMRDAHRAALGLS